MAHSTLPVFSPSTFAQLIPSVVGREIARVDRILAEAELSSCCHEEVREGVRDRAYPCPEKATVHHLASEQEYCTLHFHELSRS